jgi:hypothetical protein
VKPYDASRFEKLLGQEVCELVKSGEMIAGRWELGEAPGDVEFWTLRLAPDDNAAGNVWLVKGKRVWSWAEYSGRCPKGWQVGHGTAATRNEAMRAVVERVKLAGELQRKERGPV